VRQGPLSAGEAQRQEAKGWELRAATSLARLLRKQERCDEARDVLESVYNQQSETVLRWRRNGWSAIWGYRSRGRWRGLRPRVSSEIRHLITQAPSR
jgi:hypothetical protein